MPDKLVAVLFMLLCSHILLPSYSYSIWCLWGLPTFNVELLTFNNAHTLCLFLCYSIWDLNETSTQNLLCKVQICSRQAVARRLLCVFWNWWRDLLGWLKNLLPILYAENPIHSWREGVAHNNWVVCSSSLGRLLTGTWQQWNINKFPVVGWQAGRCGSPRYHTSTARLRQTHSGLKSYTVRNRS